jgi:glutamate racemase
VNCWAIIIRPLCGLISKSSSDKQPTPHDLQSNPVVSFFGFTENNLDRQLPIGIFDSGVGGLTVYRALHEHLPNERFVYLGDTARVPYGTKSLATVERYAVENAGFLAARGIKLLVVACNTASALALPAIRRSLNIEVVGVIGPGARAAVAGLPADRAQEGGSPGRVNGDQMRTGRPRSQRRIGVIATESTVQSGAYTAAIKKADPDAVVIERACPLFVALAEEGWANQDVARTVAETYLEDFRAGIDTLVLGCTHYPILRQVIQDAVGAQVELIDSGEAAAREVKSLLAEKDLARAAAGTGALERQLCDDLDHFYVTDAAERFARVAERFLGSKPARLEAVEIWGHDELR